MVSFKNFQRCVHLTYCILYFHINLNIIFRAREEIGQNANPKCASKANRFYKRLDRLRVINAWQYCDKVDSDFEICRWAYFNQKTGQVEPNPRGTERLLKKYPLGP